MAMSECLATFAARCAAWLADPRGPSTTLLMSCHAAGVGFEPILGEQSESPFAECIGGLDELNMRNAMLKAEMRDSVVWVIDRSSLKCVLMKKSEHRLFRQGGHA